MSYKTLFGIRTINEDLNIGGNLTVAGNIYGNNSTNISINTAGTNLSLSGSTINVVSSPSFNSLTINQTTSSISGLDIKTGESYGSLRIAPISSTGSTGNFVPSNNSIIGYYSNSSYLSTNSGDVWISGVSRYGSSNNYFITSPNLSQSPFSISQTGNVGINTTSLPTTAFQVDCLSKFTNATASTSTNTGSVQIIGGLGIGGDINIGSSLTAKAGQIIYPTTTTGQNLFNFYQPSMTTNNNCYITLGTAFSAGNCGYINFKNMGSGSSQNTMNLGMFGNAQLISLTYGGNVGINTTAPSFSLDINGTLNTNGITSITNATASSSTSTGALKITGGVGVGGTLNCAAINSNTILPSTDASYSLGSSSFRFNNIYSVNLVTVGSSRRYKKDIENISLDKCYEILDEINPKTFVIKSNNDEKVSFGFIAEEINEILDGNDFTIVSKNDQGVVSGLKYDEFIPLLWNLVKDLRNEIKELKIKVDELELNN